ncbi:hypothetical protein FRC03_006787 [Tulasnella sp. 419]|nr:hypothetical protein FRC03_006787 [Tulasnella sp. 419]
MAPKRKQGQENGSSTQSQKRIKFDSVDSLRWHWLDDTITTDAPIPLNHLLDTYAFTPGRWKNICPNKFVEKSPSKKTKSKAEAKDKDGYILISSESEDEQSSVCRIRDCRNNPQCLNYLGQTKWEDEDAAKEAFFSLHNLGMNPFLLIRDPQLPVGLKNLGATCYANAYLQVWFQDLVFREGVYQCQPMVEEDEVLEKSPVFQLQVTFAALQCSSQRVFNPIKLVESLELQTSIQQDAQEFSKLFLSHLATEFEKQPIPSLRSLVADQFQGELVHAIECQTCKNVSERSSDFVEIEINLEPGCRLEDRVKAFLAPEMLSDDNKYACGHCNSLQDAKRYTKLTKLPPVLHFSILRFVYDIKTHTRKKSKQSISYPAAIDMSQFLDKESASDSCWYDLRGVLLHKGPSAYRGHYESQVYDEEKHKWFQFNDDEVTSLNDADEEQKMNKKKSKFRVSDSDDEGDENIRRLDSKDAYMIIYSRRETQMNGEKQEKGKSLNLQPPPHAIQAVHQLNEEHELKVMDFDMRQKGLEQRFQKLKQEKQAIYKNWQISNHHEHSVVVSRKALDDWLTCDLSRRPALGYTSPPSPDEVMPDVRVQATASRSVETESADSDATLLNSSTEPTERLVVMEDSDITCSHGLLDPSKFSMMKRISKEAYQGILQQTGQDFPEVLMSDQVCLQCVRELAQERLYPTMHKLQVDLFMELQESLGKGDSYWLSKPWFKDWKTAKPRMHKSEASFNNDPSPSSDPWRKDVICPHEGLSAKDTQRMRISEEAYRFLQQLFPGWTTLSASNDECSICSDEELQRKTQASCWKQEAEMERSVLEFLIEEEPLYDPSDMKLGEPYHIIPYKFLEDLEAWFNHPTKCERPAETEPFNCRRHNRSVIDVRKCSMYKDVIRFVPEVDSEGLWVLYPRAILGDVQRVGENEWVQDPPRCDLCSPIWYMEQSFDLKVIRLPRGYPIPTPEAYETLLRNNSDLDDALDAGVDVSYVGKSYSSGSASSTSAHYAIRRSTRLGFRRRAQIVTISASLPDKGELLLHELAHATGAPVGLLRLYHKGKELGHQDTLAEFSFEENDVLELYIFDPEADEPDPMDCFWEDAEPAKTSKPDCKRAEGPAFGNTVLGGRRLASKKSRDLLNQEPMQDNIESSASPHPETIVEEVMNESMDVEISQSCQVPMDEIPNGPACPRCTFINPEGVSCCTICDSPFSIT